MELRKDRGVAGLNVLLSVVVMLFVIGFLIMIFTIMGSFLTDETRDDRSETGINQTGNVTDDADVKLTTATTYYDYSCTFVNITNDSARDTIIDTSNYTTTDGGCKLRYTGNACDNTDANCWNNSGDWFMIYDYSATEDSDASNAINDTTDSLADTTSWFGIILIITVMVVLILLTVIIIGAIRGTGALGEGGGTIGGTTIGGETVGTGKTRVGKGGTLIIPKGAPQETA